eukprot:6134764-Amphidinium_carterae.1
MGLLTVAEDHYHWAQHFGVMQLGQHDCRAHCFNASSFFFEAVIPWLIGHVKNSVRDHVIEKVLATFK